MANLSASLSLDRLHFGPVHLNVTNCARSAVFWQTAIGLQQRAETDDTVELGTVTQTLVVLHPGARTGMQPGFSGLYHLALHVTSEAELAWLLARLLAQGVRVAPTDHIMSKALYLQDPDGITVEITLETPERFGGLDTRQGLRVLDAAGQSHGGAEPLDVPALLRQRTDDDLARPLAADTTIGHLHLYVGQLDAAYQFYQALGFEPHMYAPAYRIADLGAGGAFPHRIAVNTWQGENAPPAPAGTAGLRHFSVRYRQPEARAAALARLSQPEGLEYLVRDPAGNSLLLTL